MSVSAFDGRKNNLDFIRFALATLVLYSHCYYLNDTASEDPLLRATRQIWFGGLAVNGFFAISGFLIVASWMKSGSALDYFRKRVGRIYPGFLVVCVFCVALAGPLGMSRPAEYWRHCHWGRLALSTIALGQASMPPSFPENASHVLNGSLWTIRYEFVCYIAVALCGVLGLLKRPGFVAAVAMGAYLITCVTGALHRAVLPTAEWFALDLPNLLRFLMYFAIGASLFVYRSRVPLSGTLFIVSSAMLVISGAVHKAMYIVLPPCGSYVLFYIAFHRRLNLHDFARYGDFSYGLYLYAWPIQQLCLKYSGWARSPWHLFAAALPLTFLAAVASWSWVERPALRWAHSRRLPRESGEASGKVSGSTLDDGVLPKSRPFVRRN